MMQNEDILSGFSDYLTDMGKSANTVRCYVGHIKTALNTMTPDAIADADPEMLFERSICNHYSRSTGYSLMAAIKSFQDYMYEVRE